MVIFPLDQVPEMMRGAGVRLQRYKDGGLSDVTTFVGKDGLTWLDSAGRSLHDDAQGIVGLARQSRRCRPACAQGISEEQPFRQNDQLIVLPGNYISARTQPCDISRSCGRKRLL